MIERILSLDISTKTGWAFFERHSSTLLLREYGKIDAIHTPDGEYPASFLHWADLCFQELLRLINHFKPDVIVVEETSAGSKAIYTQKILEWIHYKLARFVVDTGLKIRYILTEEWRRETGCLLSAEEKKRNAKVSRLKQKQKKEIVADESLTEEQKQVLMKSVRAKIDGKIAGRTGRKHVNVRRANEVFAQFLKEPLRKKDEDTADSLLLGYCYFLRSIKNGR